MLGPDSAHGGPGWKDRLPSTETRSQTRAKYGVVYEWGKLESVLLHRPGEEINTVTNPALALWSDFIDLALAREQHDALAELYKKCGIEVNYVSVDTPDLSKPNLYFVRDLVTLTPFGAILSRPASIVRAGEELIINRTLDLLNIPVILGAFGEATLEGSDILLVNSDLAFVGYGLRTNDKGADLAVSLLKNMGYDAVVKVQTTYGCGHLDGVVSILGRDLALLYPTRVSFLIYETLKRHGYRILDLPDQREAEIGMAINIVPLESNCVVIASNNSITRGLLTRSGVECFEIDVSELMKGGGAVHCMTGVLKRGN